MQRAQALSIAQEVVSNLEPFCEKILICGSIRRLKPEVNDIDIVALPKMVPVIGMFDEIQNYQREPGFIHAISKMQQLKGNANGKYTQRFYRGMKVEIAIATPRNFGNLVLIRTGNAEFSKRMMTKALKMGFNQRDGYLYRNDQLIPLFEEQDYFFMLGMQYIEPQDRNV
jgi:DNA polymerase/3'-5' exonuclease PolX